MQSLGSHLYGSLPDPETFCLAFGLTAITATVLKRLASKTIRPIALPEEPDYIPERDVTLVVPTIDFTEDLLVALRSWLDNKPKKIVLVTSSAYVEDLEALLEKAGLGEEEDGKIEVLATDRPNKRKQMVLGIPHASKNDTSATSIVVFADDDAYWSPSMLTYILAGFHKSRKTGVVGTFYRARGLHDPAVNSKYTFFQAVAARRLAGRRAEISASYSLDGGITCISGRTAAYRAEIVADPAFIDGFTNEKWLGTWPLNSGDDQFTSKWIVDHGWEMGLQSAEAAELETTVLEGWGFVKQWLRWQRGGQRSYLKRYPFLALNMAVGLSMVPIRPLVFICQMKLLLSALAHVARLNVAGAAQLSLIALLPSLPQIHSHISFARKHPWFWKHLPAQLAFEIVADFMSAYTMCTLHVTGWGSRNA